MGYIYKITNLINGKCYVGRTTAKKIDRRWTEHKSKAKNRPRTIIEHAIAKYGSENFKFEKLLEAENEALPLLESENIIKHNTFSPSGYNVEMYQPFKILAPESLEKLSQSQQGLNKCKTKSSKFIGAYFTSGSWYVELAKNKKRHKRIAEDEIDAATKYDKLALVLYGSRAKLNFEENRNKWTREELETFFNEFHYKERPIEQRHTYFDKSRGKWVARVKFDKRYIQLGRFATEEEAIRKRVEKLKEFSEYT